MAAVSSAHVGSGIVILVAGATVLLVGAFLAGRALQNRGKARRETVTSSAHSELQRLLEEVLTPRYGRYLEESEAAPGSDPDEMPSQLGRLRRILLEPPQRGEATVGRDEILAGLAVLEARLNNLIADLERVERNSVTQDGVTFSVLSVFGVIIALLAGLVGIVSGVALLV